MAIYDLFQQESTEEFTETFEHIREAEAPKKGHFFSTLVTRFCFLLLFLADAAWLVYNGAFLLLFTTLHLITGCKSAFLKKRVHRHALHCRRAVVCGLALLVGLFNPPFGIMVACTYFLMYDKAGMEEVVPAPLQAQFKDIFNPEK